MSMREDVRTAMARRASATGTALAAIALPNTFQRTLVSRSDLDQALVTGLSFVLHSTVTTSVQDSVQGAAFSVVKRRASRTGSALDLRRWSRAAIAADLAAAGFGAVLQQWFRADPDERLPRAGARTAGWVLSAVGAAGAAVGAIDEVTEENGLAVDSRLLAAVPAAGFMAWREVTRRQAEKRDEGLDLDPIEISPPKAAGMAVGVALGSHLIGNLESAIAGRVSRTVSSLLPGDEAVWRPLGHAAALGVMGMAGRAAMQFVFRRIEGSQFAVEPAIDVAPIFEEVSGGPGSKVDYRTLAKMGRRFVWTTRNARDIEEVTGEPARAMPIRVYVGLKSARTAEERVRLAVDELERTGAFDRSWLMVAAPTGTGYTNYAAAGALEVLTRGDCAIVSMQYSARPSPLSVDRVSEGRDQYRLLVDALHAKLVELDPEERPEVVVFGESLGAWASQDAFIHQGTDGLIAAGIDRALWIGTPYLSEWKEQVTRDLIDGVDHSLIGIFNDIGEWQALGPEERSRIRYVMITHHDDGVALFGPDLMIQQPSWLGDPETRPSGVPPSQRWIPITSFIQTLIDMKNAARVVPGQFDAKGHDYRADLVPFLAEVVGSDDDAVMLQRITESLEGEEYRRTSWIKERRGVGDTMATTILEKVRERSPEVFLEAVEAVGRDLRTDYSMPDDDSSEAAGSDAEAGAPSS